MRLGADNACSSSGGGGSRQRPWLPPSAARGEETAAQSAAGGAPRTRQSASALPTAGPEPVLAGAAAFPKDGSDAVELDSVRDSLIRQEDSIIFSLIERAQFKLNRAAYEAALLSVPGYGGSLLEYMLRETERLHGQARRYTSPTEHAFFPESISPIILPPLRYPAVLHPAADAININGQVWKMYLEDLLPAIAAEGDDFNYGSSVTADVVCLQALSRRVHYGKFVAEAKYRESPQLYDPLIRAQDADGLMRLLTFPAVEAKVRARVERKAATFGQDVDAADDGAPAARPSYKVEPHAAARLYGEWIMPLTKQVQVKYLLRRLD